MKRLAFTMIAILLFGMAVEGGSRILYLFKAQLRSLLANTAFEGKSLNLDAYEVSDPKQPGHWRLRPGFSMTMEEVIEEKKRSGKVLAAQYYTKRIEELSLTKNDVFMRINRDGFRGPEIDTTHSRLRILTLGDSCTFGTFESYSYSRTLEGELRTRGSNAEVINGGVEGYSPQHVLARIDEFKALRPEVTTLYLGWNALFNEQFSKESAFYSIRLFKTGYQIIRRAWADPQKEALKQYHKPKHPDRESVEVKDLKSYAPSFMDDIEQIVREMQAAGSLVVLLTLPGLYTMEEEPTLRALEVGHLPPFTDNPYVLAKMTEQYNMALRRLAKEVGLQIIDLEGWSQTALQPREDYFFDSVHLYEEGQKMIGEYMAQELLGTLPSAPPSRGD